jgi:TonB-linked SusC/RagA family outer membrane protein
MRLILLYLIVGITIVFADEADSQTLSVTIKVTNTPAKEVIGEIEKQTDYLFVYDYNRVDLSRKVTLDKSRATVTEVLSEMFENTDITYAMEGKNILLMKRHESLERLQALRTITGTVVDISTGEPIIGASIMEKGTSAGTITDVDGKFIIRTASATNVILQISYIGYITQDVAATGNTVKVLLKENTQIIDEVVVVGYGTQRRNDVTGAIASIGENILKEIPGSNISQSMQGRLAGVNIQQTATHPGADTQIRIRGTRSLAAENDPLIIVDGIPFLGKLNDITPEDIKSVDILKDASSTAIYGSRGANGVILITTNRSHTGKPVISWNGYYGISTVARKYEVFSAEEFIKVRELSGYQAGSPYLPQEEQYFRTGKSYDWQDEMYQSAHVSSQDISLMAGSETIQGNIGINYYNTTSVLPGQDFTRYSIRGNNDIRMNRWLKVGFNTQESFSITHGEGVDIVALYEMLANSPLVNPYDDKGRVIVQPLAPREDAYSPLLLKDKSLWEQERKRFSALNSLYAEIQIIPQLKYRVNLGLNYFRDQYGEYYSSASPFKDGSTSSAAVTGQTVYNYDVENLLYYDATFSGKHRLGATAMYSVEDQYVESTRAEALNLTADYMKYHNLGMANDGVSYNGNKAYQVYNRRALISYMARVNYSYADKYIATVTGRVDGSSVLAAGNKWHAYPAVSLAWNMKKENFLKNTETLEWLKLRLGYGQTSNQSVRPYETLGSLGQNKYNFGSDLVYGYYTQALRNDNLGWEYTHSYNAGIDFSLWQGRLSGTADIYLQKTSDLLVYQKLPPTGGISDAVLVNVGKTENKGLELTLRSENFLPASPGSFSWSTDFNLYINRNKLLSLNSGVTQDEANGWFVGYPIDVIYDYNKLGIWQTNEAEEAAKYGFQPGDIKLEDANHDNIFSEADRYVIHKFEPDAEMGMTNRFGFKGFDLTVVAFSQIGGTLVSSLHQNQSYLNVLNGVRNNIKVNYWTPDTPTNDNPRPLNSGGARPYSSTLGYFDGSYLKIQTMTLGYNFPRSALEKRLGVHDLRLYLTCNNVATLFSPYMQKGGLDPQPTGYGAQGVGGVGSNQKSRQLTVTLSTPPLRQLMLGISMKL